jgi:hypothetical protein
MWACTKGKGSSVTLLLASCLASNKELHGAIFSGLPDSLEEKGANVLFSLEKNVKEVEKHAEGFTGEY